MSSPVPVVLTFAGNDPSGGAGIQADIEALASQGCHCAPVITALTVQDTRDIHSLAPIDGILVAEQARAVLEDMPVAVIKIGLLGSVDIIENIHAVLIDYPDIPVVLDPVLASGNGSELVDEETLDAMLKLLLPHTTLLTPNSLEVRSLAPEGDTLEACAMALLAHGTEFVLVTGTHENTQHVVNHLFGNNRLLESFTWERLAGSYHGSGCTLASACAGLLAQGLEPFGAVHEAQEYTWETLKQGYRLGMGQQLPNRLFWARPEEL
ncbi:bifunctional hydroxymethylpyrimidine kinase/phosphomethylpyrimidine kinase [Thiohalobacter thiocyanaticus]|uniref:hydroxymethylpyrimidine kinase n=1 Tax=Thiohalobacter thiocyanaticus TaxID=585455 RepID=A0A426QI97_9GAMM|nr:hydroxymethylpyrimidine/phosphomethylpyrimidine kinase [Thiohalobacter thiocyanaticus]RRQ21470.1 hydroxymethylpyrimidine/phosphomethylpyrimidine kinase [Thiohalobacter thiocyanaticus]